MSRQRWRTVLPVTLLLAALVLAALLAVQAQYAASSHREAARSAVADYAGLAAAELTRRAAVEVGYSGVYPLISARTKGQSTAEVRASADPRIETALPLVASFFELGRVGSAAVERTFDGQPPSTAIQDWLLGRVTELQRVPGPRAPFRTAHGVVDGQPVRFAVARASRDSGTWLGIVLDEGAVAPFVETVLGGDGLLPETITDGPVANDGLVVRVLDSQRQLLFRAGPRPQGGPGVGPGSGSSGESAWIGGEVPFGDSYGGVLDGLVAQVEIGPEVAAKLVRGGVPRSRAPVFIGLLLLTAALIFVALAQIQRERALVRLRGDFVANVSHELRTPLTQIRMFAATVLLDRVRSEEERKRALAVIDAEARRLGHLVDNVLRFARAERGDDPLVLSARRLAPLIQAVIDDQSLGAASGLGVAGATRIETRLDPEATAEADPDAVRQLLLNLLDNAEKYGPEGQTVRVELERRGGTVVLAVEDEGGGVPEPQRRRVFRQFERLEQHREQVAGTGIGLAVVGDLVRRHNGRCRIEDGERGARVVVELPAVAAAGDVAPEAAPESSRPGVREQASAAEPLV